MSPGTMKTLEKKSFVSASTFCITVAHFDNRLEGFSNKTFSHLILGWIDDAKIENEFSRSRNGTFSIVKQREKSKATQMNLKILH